MGYFDSIYAAELPLRAVSGYKYLKNRANAEGHRPAGPAGTPARRLDRFRAALARKRKPYFQQLPAAMTCTNNKAVRQRDGSAVYAGQGGVITKPPEVTI